MNTSHIKKLFLPILVFAGAFTASLVWTQNLLAGPKEQAEKLYTRITSLPIKYNDPAVVAKVQQIQAAISAGDWTTATNLATSEDAFYNITVKNWAKPLSNRAMDPSVRLNDFVATVIGITKDDLNAQLMLTGNFIYKGSTQLTGTVSVENQNFSIHAPAALYQSNAHYNFLEGNNINLRRNLFQSTQMAYPAGTINLNVQPVVLTDAAGLLTTRQWAQEHIVAGTNRRPIEFAMKIFLCSEIDTLRDPGILPDRIRRDVDRAPGGDTNTFATSCQLCHGGMDALAGSMAYFDWSNITGNAFALRYTPGAVRGKMNQNPVPVPAGSPPAFTTTDDSWKNYWATAHIPNPNPGSGRGIASVGQMLANSGAFSYCMAKRVFTFMCRRDATLADDQDIQEFAADFSNNGYRLKRLFSRIAVHGPCLGQ